jgi:hypothetical protein
MVFGPEGGAGQTHAYTYANSQVHEGGNFHSSLTKDLQLKWGSLGSEEQGAANGRMVLKSLEKVFP